MVTRTLFIALALAGTGIGQAFAYDGREVSLPARQNAAEVEDIGVVAEGGTTAPDGKDAKSVPPPAAKPSHFRLNIGLAPTFTSNAQLSGDHKSGDFLFLPKVEAGYRLPIGTKFSLDTVARLESGIYGRYTDRTFIGYSLQSTFDYRPIAKGPRLFLSVEPYRLDRFDGQGLITEAFALSAGTDWGYGFNNGNSLAFIGYALTDHFSDPNSDSRVNHAVTVGYTQVLTSKLIGQVYYQYQHDNYQSFSRDDDRHSVGLSVTYQIDRHFFTTFSASFADNDSTQNNASYQSAGFGISLNYQY